MGSQNKVEVEWPFRQDGPGRIYTAFVKVGFCHFKCVLKSVIDQHRPRAEIT